MFVTRLISGIILVIIAGASIWFGADVLFAFSLIISLIGLSEIYHLKKLEKSPAGIFGYAAVIAYYFLIRQTGTDYFSYFLVLFLILLLTVYVFAYPKYNTEEMLVVFFGVFYVPVMVSYVYMTRLMKNGLGIVWLIFISSWICDTCAYCVGMITAKTVGNHKMAPKLSPKKSFEGAIGGVVGAFLIGMLYGKLAGGYLTEMANPMWECAILCSAGSVISQIGDFAASAIKRNYNIKDYGKLIPGHGGIVDRFDSVIFTAPVVYFMAAVVLPAIR